MKFTIGTIVLLVLNALVAVRAQDVRAQGGGAYGTGYAMGYALGAVVFVLLIGGVALLVARLLGKAREPGAGAKVVFWSVAAVSVLHMAGFAARGLRSFLPTPVTDAERHGLEIGPDSIRHRGFGFVVPHPGPAFRPDSEMQRQVDEQFAGQPTVAAWVLMDVSRTGMVMLQVTKGGAVSQTSLRAFARGVRTGVSKGAGITVLEDSVTWSGSSGEYRFRGQNQAGVLLGVRCVPGSRRDAPVIICVETVSAERGDGLGFVREGLAVGR